jgi:O-antigen ligase
MTAAPRRSLWLLAATVVLLPLLVPRGPGQSAPVDVVAGAYILVALAGRGRSGRPLRLPAMGPLLTIFGASLVATAFGLNLAEGMLSLLVEGYLLVLFVHIANHLADDQRSLRTILTVWSAAAVGWAAVFVGLYFQVLPAWLQGVLLANGPEGGTRVAGASGNPNLAASYLLTSFFVLVASPWPRHRTARLAAAGAVLFGLYLTGSNGALLGLAVGLPVLLLAAAMQRTSGAGERQGVVGAALLAGGLLLGVVVLTAGVPKVEVSEVQALATREKAGALGGNVGRLDRSVNGRLAIWSNAWGAAGPRVLVGVGPGSAPEIPFARRTLRRGLHNDYLAFLIERGILGLLGLLAFVVVLLRWSGRLLQDRLPDGRRRWSVAGLAGAVVANLVLATNHESFHFRHVWVLFALTWAATQLMARARPEPADRIVPDPTPKELAHAGP